MKKLYLSIVFLLISFVVFSKPNISLDVPDAVFIDEPFNIRIDVTEINNVSLVNIPTTDNVRIAATGTFSNVSIVNGSYSTSTTFVFTVRAEQSGEISIGAFEFKDRRNQRFFSEPFTLRASERANISAQEESVNNKIKTQGRRHYFLELFISNESPYLNEFVEVELRLYAISQEVRLVSAQPITFPSNAWIENIDLKQTGGTIKIIDGARYTEYLLEKKRVCFSEIGDMVIPQVEYVITVYNHNGFFSFPERLMVRSDETTLSVRPLPGNESVIPVGNLEINSNISSLQTETGVPITLTAEVKGLVNFQLLNQSPFIIDDGLEVFTSKRTEDGIGTANRTVLWESVLMPVKSGNHLIRVMPIAYFNPSTGEYQTTTEREYLLTVSGNDIIGGSERSSASSLTPRDTVIEDPDDLTLIVGCKWINYRNVRLLFYLLIIILSIIFALLIIVYIAHKLSYIGSEITSRLRDGNNFEKAIIYSLNKAGKKCSNNEKIDIIYNSFESILIKVFKIDNITLTRNNIPKIFEGKLEKSGIDKLIEIIKYVDMLRFAGTPPDDGSIEKIIEMIKDFSGETGRLKK